MSDLEWPSFLSDWSAAAGAGQPPRAGAVPEALDALERRLKASIPTDYLAFLRASDGWDDPSGHPLNHIRGSAEVKPVASEDPDLFATWGRAPKSRLSDGVYFSYTDAAATEYRPSQMRYGFVLCGGERSREGDAVVLLNPQVVWPDGCWEVWLVANWLPGVKRYRDFTSLMLDAASKHFDVQPYREQWRRRLPEGPPTVYTGAPGSSRRTGAPALLPNADQLLQTARSGKFLERLRAIKAMAGSGDDRIGAELIRLARHESDHRLRKTALEAMAPRGDPEAVDVLCDTFENDESLRHYAAAALAGIRHPRATEVLRTALESNDVATFESASFALVQRRDETVLPAMLKIALGMPEGREAWNDLRVRVAWTLLFSIGEPAADALVEALDHPNPRVRFQAALTLPEARLRDHAIQGKVIATLADVAEALPGERAMVEYHLENMRERLAFMNAPKRRQ
jgi:hypothetical protein